ncbi:hypothetical protein PIB30_066304 [Stylosanthes scabra]|uniref:Uncharacterized protein n=1 Tax=Stylosanthes scabra TaxID=79078 RepID=A0ABU6TNV7_9FABA|nr:hypothetical protein [Stylosanthes scabra]
MFDLHHRYETREVMELLTEMLNLNGDVGGPSSSSRGGLGAIPASPIQCATPEVSDEDSDEDFVGDLDDSSESSDSSEFVPEFQTRRAGANLSLLAGLVLPNRLVQHGQTVPPEIPFVRGSVISRALQSRNSYLGFCSPDITSISLIQSISELCKSGI